MNDTSLNNSICDFDGDIAGHMYDEIGDAENLRVVNHLAVCPACFEEVAAIGGVRSSIDHWKASEFATLATPNFALNLDLQSTDNHSPRWLSFWRNSNFRVPAFAGLAALLIVGSIFVLRFTAPFTDITADMNPQKSGEVGPGSNVGLADANIRSASPPPAQEEQIATVSSPPSKRDSSPTAITSRRQTALASSNRRKRKDSANQDETIRPPDGAIARRKQSVPSLNEFEEQEDKTLRLGDILADIDAG